MICVCKNTKKFLIRILPMSQNFFIYCQSVCPLSCGDENNMNDVSPFCAIINKCHKSMPFTYTHIIFWVDLVILINSLNIFIGFASYEFVFLAKNYFYTNLNIYIQNFISFTKKKKETFFWNIMRLQKYKLNILIW